MKPYIIENITPQNKNYQINIDSIKKHLLIEDDENNENIMRCYFAAIDFIENFTSHKILEQEYKVTYKRYVPSELVLSMFPVNKIYSISCTFNQEKKIIKETEYNLLFNKKIAFIYPIIANSIEVVLSAGYSDHNKIPASLKSAIKLKTISLFMGIDSHDKAINQLIQPFKTIRI